MGQQIIEVLVGPNGEVKIEAHGYKGKSCEEATKFLEDALGDKADVKKKAEWYIKNSSNLRRQRRYGVDGSKLCG